MTSPDKADGSTMESSTTAEEIFDAKGTKPQMDVVDHCSMKDTFRFSCAQLRHYWNIEYEELQPRLAGGLHA